MQVVLAEKPSVARDIAAVLGATHQKKGYLQGNGYAVTWALGHLVTLPQPHEINATWKRWSRATLPLLPQRWPLAVIERTKDQFAIVQRLINAQSTTTVICATDAGREGELIFRLIGAHAKCRKPVLRLWISSLTPSAIATGFARLTDAGQYDALAQAALGRSQADWLVGMNLTRAYSLGSEETLTVGRVQTPTLAMVVERDETIAAFKPEQYWELWLSARADNSRPPEPFEARHMNSPPSGSPQTPRISRFPAQGRLAQAALARVKRATLQVVQISVKPRSQPPPRLYDLTELQRHAHRALGLSAQRTLDIAQQLYEKYKAISYPRTNCRHLSADVARQLPPVVAQLAERYSSLLPAEQKQQLLQTDRHKALGKRFVDDTRLTDHHAIIPTYTQQALPRLPQGSDAARLFDLICRRLLAAFLPDHRFTETELWVEARSAPSASDSGGSDFFRARGKVVLSLGYRVVEGSKQSKRGNHKEADSPDLPHLQSGQKLHLLKAETESKETKPPLPFNDASLLTAMETAGRSVEDQELSYAMRDQGLGTPATRAAILEGLITRCYLQRQGKNLHSTAKAQHLIGIVHPIVRSPAMTGQWELKLRQIELGKGKLSDFIVEIQKYVTQVVKLAATAPPHSPVLQTPNSSSETKTAPSQTAASGAAALGTAASTTTMPPPPSSKRGDPLSQPPALFDNLPPRPNYSTGRAQLPHTLKRVFGHAQFRANQQNVCERITEGQSHLLVMPTGAGKSLCYQLPGIARSGTTLVISPLIALMDDQVDKLRALGLRAERLHSGRDRQHARAVCREYLDGQLDFLFIAPERLAVHGFPEMLAKRKLALIAIDEAHCISQWGHDFRPDYRLLAKRLPHGQGTPVVALTATATHQVQQDIVQQLGVPNVRRAVHGFRRTNLQIEVTQVAVKQRASVCEHLLRDPARRPAIVYSPTRKMATAVADHLRNQSNSEGLRVAAYHAGMPAEAREDVQNQFLSGTLDAIVATVAFGMGIDKPNVRCVVHLALPGSVEGYYQEIGRAGRDGKPSLALLLCAQTDRRTHDFFLARDYPPAERLIELYNKLSTRPRKQAGLGRALGIKKSQAHVYLEKLLSVGGAVRSGADEVTQGNGSWRQPYLDQVTHRHTQIDNVLSYVEGPVCRMLQLVQHFGDEADDGQTCGHCDRCQPGSSLSSKVLQVAAQTHSKYSNSGSYQADNSPSSAGRTGKKRTGKRRSRRSTRAAVSKATLEQTTAPARLVDNLRSFRLEEAKRRKVPAYRIFSNKLLIALAESQPADARALENVSGAGATFCERHGSDVLKILGGK